jgi:Ca2+-binding RTX toxin-like protein
MTGGSGNDLLDGGAGNDRIYGDQDPAQLLLRRLAQFIKG